MNILVSACLLGVNCKYSGGNNFCPSVAALGEEHTLVPVCPEQLGGLPTPREPAERKGDRVVTRSGGDVTARFRAGAQEALRIAERTGCRTAVLKARSPSCGPGPIYDGGFRGCLTEARGVTAALLAEHGITVLSEEDLPSPGDRAGSHGKERVGGGLTRSTETKISGE